MPDHIPASEQLEVGAIYEHESGIQYRLDKIILNATNYESGKTPEEFVLYTQLKDGHFPAGTQWTRERSDFANHFSKA